jgi:phosphate transport system substrate-binding protein
MKLKNKFYSLALSAVIGFGASTVANAQVDPKIPNYSRVSGVSGNVTSIGSDTLNNLMTLWAEEFAKFYPNVNIQIQGAGSSTAPPALIEGTSNFGPMSRAMRDSEIQAFEKKYGYKPLAIPVAVDLLAVYVNKDNPIKGLTLQQVDAIFSETRRCGGSADITRWGQVGLDGRWSNRDITLYSRNAVSGTYGYFKDVALFGGDYSPDVREQPGSSTVIQGVAADINGIGYSGIGYGTADVKAIDIRGDDGICYKPIAKDAAEGNYPLARFLYVYVNANPNQKLEPLRGEFIKYVYSQEGQSDVIRAGFFPLVKSVADADLKDFGLQ